jgi:wobble nucleotide-excising tRNase
VLEKIISIDNIGVIKSGISNALDLKKVTLIYSDNARGKSTLAALMSACGAGDAPELVKRKTIGATTDQKVNLRFKSSNGNFNAQFDGKDWSGDRPNLHVFNQEFVERNVYASGGVSPEQRASLLELALGDAAVVQRLEFQKQGEIQRACAGKVATSEGALTGFRSNLSVDQFIALGEIADVEAQIHALDKRISDTLGTTQTLNKPEFKKLIAPNFNLDDFKAVAVSEFEQIQDGAEALVKKHFAEHKGGETERWVSDGLLHIPEPNCPFCGQKTESLDILAAYKGYFNQAYRDHQTSVSTIKSLATQSVSVAALSEWAGMIDFVLPTIDIAVPQKIIIEAQSILVNFAEKKTARPLDALGSESIDAVLVQLSEVTAMAETFNTQIDAVNQKILDYKKSLVDVDSNVLTKTRTTLALHKVRHDAAVKSLIEAVTTARAEHKAAETAKDAAKAQLDKVMEQVLFDFQKAINEWLVKFGAPFKLKELKPTYISGAARSQYVIDVRGAAVPVGPTTPGTLSFHAALSEGDKRTLAFAFFLSKLFADPSRADSVVVLDDVFTSLDKDRRHNTVEAAVKIADECAQVIALGHDAHFLRELRKRAVKKKVGETLELCLHRDEDNYSVLTDFDLDEYCSSDYYKHYVLVEKFITASIPLGQHLDVAKALRLLVEGHLHRCFPKHFKEGQTLGVALDAVKNAKTNSPLVALRPLFQDLVNFNEYAAAYHHETSVGQPRTETTDTELQLFAKAAIGFIQARKLW